jgi:hypothetical protein
MRSFFKGRRRKVGVVTLLLALVFTGGWVKGSTTDELPVAGKIGLCWSNHRLEGDREVEGSQIELTGFYRDWSLPPEPKEPESEPTVQFRTDVPGVFADFGIPVSGLSGKERAELERQVVHVDMNAPNIVPEGLTTLRWQHAGFYVNRTSIADSHWETTVFIPYWSIVIPLTLLSAVLLIKPRAAKPRLQTVPAPSF